jgi:hypothetical protein
MVISTTLAPTKRGPVTAANSGVRTPPVAAVADESGAPRDVAGLGGRARWTRKAMRHATVANVATSLLLGHPADMILRLPVTG